MRSRGRMPRLGATVFQNQREFAKVSAALDYRAKYLMSAEADRNSDQHRNECDCDNDQNLRDPMRARLRIRRNFAFGMRGMHARMIAARRGVVDASAGDTDGLAHAAV